MIPGHLTDLRFLKKQWKKKQGVFYDGYWMSDWLWRAVPIPQSGTSGSHLKKKA
jgi:hypothetical protein